MIYCSILVAVCALGCAAVAVLYLRARRTIASLRAEAAALRAAQTQQEQALNRRSHLDTIKDEFISTVSHELRTPLTSIRGALGLLSAGVMGTVDSKSQNLLRIALTNTDRLVRLINDILDLERMESGRATLQFRRCVIGDLALQAVETVTSMADAAQVRIELTTALLGNPIVFDGDADRILQVFTNLLSNAIKFSPPHSTITIHAEPTETSLLITVSDEGRGIPTDKLDSIFDRFQQVESSDARQKGGTGLGLAICRSIVQQHGGSIWATPNPVAGVTLSFQLPRSIATVLHPAPDATLPRGDATILVCDDDPGIRTIVATHLRSHGYTVIEADRGEQVIALAIECAQRSQPIEAILLDLYMPGLSGWETLQRIKNNPATAGIPVVVLSVLSPSSHIPDGPGLAASAQGWVQKPFNENLLISELSRVLHAGDGPGHVLLVEDDLDLATVITAGFESIGSTGHPMRIDHATTLHQAMEFCRSNPPDLLILDLTLPDGDGFSLVEWLRRQPALRTLPLVVYSGQEVSDQEMSKLLLGPTQFLTKAKVQPHEVEELVLAMVHRLRTPATDGAAPVLHI